MASIIRATTTSGLQIAPDNSGSLQLQTNGTTAAVTIDTSQNVGIGTASPTNKLTIGGTNSNIFFKNADATTGYAACQIVNTGGSFYFGLTSSTGALWANTAGNYAATIGTSNATNLSFATNDNVRMVIDSSGNVTVGKTALGPATAGIQLEIAGTVGSTRSGEIPFFANRLTNDGDLFHFRQDSTTEGTISVSGTTVSYNGGHLSRWSQLSDGSKNESIVKGTVLSNLDDMCIWEKDGIVADNEQLNKMKVSNVEGDTNVAGVFVNWTMDEDYGVDDMNVAMTGDMIIRIAEGIVVQKGDLLMSAGDGTAKPQGDDIVRSKTIAKVTSTYITCTYADGSYCVPCVLMAC
jgi:hypothetical protein